MKREYTQMTPLELNVELDHLHEMRHNAIDNSITNDIDNLDKLASTILTIDDTIAKVEAALARKI